MSTYVKQMDFQGQDNVSYIFKLIFVCNVSLSTFTELLGKVYSVLAYHKSLQGLVLTLCKTLNGLKFYF